MGRETRQQRRARERREQQRGRAGAGADQPKMSVIAGIAVVVAILVVLIGLLATGTAQKIAGASPTPTEVPGKTVAGIGCDPQEVVTYHVHAHLTITNRGKAITIPAGIGFNYTHDCLYWLHTHNTDGIVHIEAPHQMSPPLRDLFLLWGKPLTSQQVGPVKVGPGEEIKTYVNGKLFTGDPATIKLKRHTTIYIEVGPPFVKPHKYNYGVL